MTYTPEELAKAKDALDRAPRPLTLAPSGPVAARIVLDAVLPGYTQRIQAETLTRFGEYCEAEYERLTAEHGSYGETKLRAAFRLAAQLTRIERRACIHCATNIIRSPKGQWQHEHDEGQGCPPTPAALVAPTEQSDDEMPPGECWCPPVGLDTGCPLHGIDAPAPPVEQP